MSECKDLLTGNWLPSNDRVGVFELSLVAQSTWAPASHGSGTSNLALGASHGRRRVKVAVARPRRRGRRILSKN